MQQKRLPIIGILTKIKDDGEAVINASFGTMLESLGAVAVGIPYCKSEAARRAYVELCDGFIFSGGDDIDPALYGASPSEKLKKTAPLHDEADTHIMPMIFESGKPALGICRGMQMMNVLHGGTLYQDLPSEVGESVDHSHPWESGEEKMHEISLPEGSPLREIFGTERATVNTLHHQAVKELGAGLTVAALADDGVVEAIYKPEHKFLWGIQWHPERLFGTEQNIGLKLVEKLVEAAK